MFDIFIRRPILSLVISLFITLLGALSFFTLPIELFPEIAPPSIKVRAKYRGANAEVGSNTVATPLEKVINGVPGMTYLTSVSSNRGANVITEKQVEGLLMYINIVSDEETIDEKLI